MEQQDLRSHRPTWAEIDLDNLSYNLAQVKKKLKDGVKVMACVKAEAYGHGLIPVSKELVSSGVDFLAVASIDEAIALREAAIDCRILVLGLVLEQDVPSLLEHRISPTVCSMPLARALNRYASTKSQIVDIHIKVDTGMGRIGVAHEKAYSFVKDVATLKNIRIEGIFTHLACADSDRELTLRQLHLFEAVVGKLKKDSLRIPLVHAANSIGAISYPQSHFNMVRPGIILYGLHPAEGLAIDVRPVMSLKTQAVYVKDVCAGTGISYGHTYVTHKPARIVTLPIGYGDGYPRNLSNIGPVLINGRRFRISGRVCMDQVMADVGDSRVSVGDEAVLMGTNKGLRISAEELAFLSHTIPYEIVCGIGSRVPRLYRKKAAFPQEQRKAVRRRQTMRVRFLDTPELKDMPAVTADISSTGMKLYTADPVCPYRWYRFSLESRFHPPVHVTGKAVWMRPLESGLYACGIKFAVPKTCQTRINCV